MDSPPNYSANYLNGIPQKLFEWHGNIASAGMLTTSRVVVAA